MQQDVLNDNTPEETTTFFKGTIEEAAHKDHTISAQQQIAEDLGADWERKIALGLSLELTYAETVEEIQQSEYDDNVFTYGSKEYLVCTDSEADEKWEEDLDNYIDECVLPEISEPYRNYFDDERFKNDCKLDGRGHSLALYDGNEEEQKVAGVYYYIYRQN